MPKEDDDQLSPEDLASFEAMSDDDIKQVERFQKWRQKKSGAADPPKQNPPSPQNSLGDMKSLTIGQLEELTKAGPATRSILRNLLDAADLSEKSAPTPAAKKSLIPKTNLRLL